MMENLAELGQVKHIEVAENIKLRYLVSGKGQPLILLHTIRTQLDYFKEVIPTLAKHYTVYAIDLPGHGGSSIDMNASYDEPYLRKAVSTLITQLDLKGITLAGESIGAVLALTVASTIPERISHVVTSNAYDYDTRYADGVRRGNVFANFVLANYAVPVHGAIFAALENWLFLGLVMRGGLRIKKWMPKVLLSTINKAGYRKGFRYVERNVFDHWQSWSEASALYAGVKAPVKLIYSEYDWSSVAERQRTAKALGTSIITLPKAGHFGFIDDPKTMLEIVLGQR